MIYVGKNIANCSKNPQFIPFTCASAQMLPITAFFPTYVAETMACAMASSMAQGVQEIILNNHGVVKARPTQRKGTIKDQDYRDVGYRNMISKHLSMRWTLGHQEL